MDFWVSLVLGIVIVLGEVIVSLLLFLSLGTELRGYLLYRFTPAKGRLRHFFKFANTDNQLLFLLGTIHGAHLKSEGYSLLHIRAVIRNLQPDLLLIESRVEEMAKNNLADGPLEMLFAHLTAKTLGIPVMGIDWWKKERLRYFRSSSTAREEHLLQNILSAITSYKRILVITGFSHVLELTKRFPKKGFPQEPFPEEEKEALFNKSATEQLLFPKEMAFYIRKRITIEKNNLLEEDNSRIRRKLQKIIIALERILAYVENNRES